MWLSGNVMCLFYCRKLAAETTLDRSLPPKIRLRKTFFLTYEVILKIAVSGSCLMGYVLNNTPTDSNSPAIFSCGAKFNLCRSVMVAFCSNLLLSRERMKMCSSSCWPGWQ